MATELSPELRAQLEGMFASRLETQVAAARETLQAEMTAQLGARFEELRGAGAGLEAQLAESRRVIAQLQAQLASLQAERDAVLARFNVAVQAAEGAAKELEELRAEHMGVLAERDTLRTRLAATQTSAAKGEGAGAGDPRIDKKDNAWKLSEDRAEW